MKPREVHRKIKIALKALEKKNSTLSISVKTIAETTGLDIRTVRSHLEMLEEYDLGLFCDDRKATFSTYANLAEKICNQKFFQKKGRKNNE